LGVPVSAALPGAVMIRLATAYVALLALLALTVASTFIPLGPINTVINLAVAVAKAGIILIVFMGLRRAGPLPILAAATAGFWLLILFGLSWIGLRGV
jgi:cytochrome c oxidase subunit 4